MTGQFLEHVMFKKSFDKYVCVNDSIACEIGGLTFRATILRDEGDEGDLAYCGLCVAVEYPNRTTLFEPAAIRWGVECNRPGSDNNHLQGVANELLPEATANAANYLRDLGDAMTEFLAVVSVAPTTSASMMRFADHPQSNGFPVIQVWREDSLGCGGWCWVRTPGDFARLTEPELAAIRALAAA
jgi:hypothetical protein